MSKNITIKKVPENFEEQILKREHYSVTEFGNAIALPHPMKPITDENVCCCWNIEKTSKMV